MVLVEEAAEVMEAQILASLAPSVEHAIFIGDHEQLRPKANLWEMQVGLGPDNYIEARSRSICILAHAAAICSSCYLEWLRGTSTAQSKQPKAAQSSCAVCPG